MFAEFLIVLVFVREDFKLSILKFTDETGLNRQFFLGARHHVTFDEFA
jgi:hypothetical protein